MHVCYLDEASHLTIAGFQISACEEITAAIWIGGV